ncbi:MAG: Hsp20/alpha crystallin family protein [Cyclobacteriaceae bacterium]
MQTLGGYMYYDVSKKEVHRILTSSNIMNTWNGGMAEAQIDVQRDLNEYHVTVTIPGISEDRLKAEIADKHLIVSHLMEFKLSNGKTAIVPHVLAACPLSLDIDHSNIKADYSNGVLQVSLPLSDFSSGYRREINISSSSSPSNTSISRRTASARRSVKICSRDLTVS